MSDWVICPNCKGRKETRDWFTTVFTFGLSELVGCVKDECRTCNGTGYIRPPNDR